MRSRGAAFAAGVVLVGAAACSGSDAANTAPPDPTAVDGTGGADSEVFGDADASPPETLVVVSFDPVAETGVPGIDSDDAFCRSWSEYAGSVQAISLAWLVQTPVQAASLEMSASAALVAAVDGMATHLPAEIETNRQALTVDVPAPTLRRGARSEEFLLAQGLTTDDITQLGQDWLEAISAAGLNDENLAIDLESEVATAVAAAAEEFVAALPSFVADPTLDTTAFDISPSLDYISDNCPDQGTLAGNDIIE